MGLVAKDDGWRIPDELWAEMERLLPARPPHPLGCHNPRVPDRDAMNSILFVLRTGCQWNALDATGICLCSSAYRRFREWTGAGVFLELWRLVTGREDREQAVEEGDLEDFPDLAVGADDPQLPAVRAQALERAEEDAQHRRVDEGRLGQVDDDSLRTLVDEAQDSCFSSGAV